MQRKAGAALYRPAGMDDTTLHGSRVAIVGAGVIAEAMLSGLLSRGLLAGGDGWHHPDQAVHDRLSAPGRDLSYRLTPDGEAVLGELGIDLDAVLARRPAARYCLDWSEQRHHLAGPLGTALADRLFELGWVTRGQRRRVVRVTEAGQARLPSVLGLPAGWADPAPVTYPNGVWRA